MRKSSKWIKETSAIEIDLNEIELDSFFNNASNKENDIDFNWIKKKIDENNSIQNDDWDYEEFIEELNENDIKEIEIKFSKNTDSYQNLQDFLSINRFSSNSNTLFDSMKNSYDCLWKSMLYISFILSNKIKFIESRWNIHLIKKTNEELCELFKELNSKKRKTSKERIYLDDIVNVILFKNIRFFSYFINKEFRNFWLIEFVEEDLFQCLLIITITSISKFKKDLNFKFSSFLYYQLFKWINIVSTLYWIWLKEPRSWKYNFMKIYRILEELYWEEVNFEWKSLIYEDVVNDWFILDFLISKKIPKKAIVDWTLHKAIDFFNWNSSWTWLKNFISVWWNDWNELTFNKEWEVISSIDFDDSFKKYDFLKSFINDILFSNRLNSIEMIVILLRFWLLNNYEEEIFKKLDINEIENKKKNLIKKISKNIREIRRIEEFWEIKKDKELKNELKKIKKEIKEDESMIKNLDKTKENNFIYLDILNQIIKDWDWERIFTLLEIWKKFWITRERIRQIESKVLKDFFSMKELELKKNFFEKLESWKELTKEDKYFFINFVEKDSFWNYIEKLFDWRSLWVELMKSYYS